MVSYLLAKEFCGCIMAYMLVEGKPRRSNTCEERRLIVCSNNRRFKQPRVRDPAKNPPTSARLSSQYCNCKIVKNPIKKYQSLLKITFKKLTIIVIINIVIYYDYVKFLNICRSIPRPIWSRPRMKVTKNWTFVTKYIEFKKNLEFMTRFFGIFLFHELNPSRPLKKTG